MRTAQDAVAYMPARKRRAVTEGNAPPASQSRTQSRAARVWLLIAWLLIVGVVLYVVFIR